MVENLTALKTKRYWMYVCDMVGLNKYPKVEYSWGRIFKDTKNIGINETGGRYFLPMQ